MMESLKQQLMDMDFVQEIEKAEAYQTYYIEDEDEENSMEQSQQSPDFMKKEKTT